MDKDARAACSPVFERQMEQLSLLRALGDENRLLLLGRLATASRPLTVTEASSCCGIHISGVSRHLGILKQAGVAIAEKRGREVVYRANVEAVVRALRAFADTLSACACDAPDQTLAGVEPERKSP